MNTNNSFRQFVKDGMVGVAVVFIIFALYSLFYLQEFRVSKLSEFFEFVAAMFFFPKFEGRVYFSPMPFVLLIAFLGSGIGGRFFESVSTRGDWIKPAFLTAFISWLIICVPIFLLLLSGGWESAIDFMPWVLVPTSVCAGIGFVSASLIGMVFNPITRVRRILIGAIASTMTGYGFGLMIFAIQGM